MRCRVRLADGRMFCGELPPERHRALHLGLLHAQSDGLVELAPGTRPPGGKVDITPAHPARALPTRRRHRHARLARRAARTRPTNRRRRLHPQALRRPAARGGFRRRDPAHRAAGHEGRGRSHPRLLWIDVDRPEQLPRLWTLLAERPCHLLIESAGSGGMHAYFKLDRAARGATRHQERRDDRADRARQRGLIHCLGSDAEGNPTVADPACRKRSQPMRLAGTINFKTGRYARIVDADFQMTPYSLEALVGDLPDPPWATPVLGRFEAAGEPGPVQADPAAGVLRDARRDHGAAARRSRALPGAMARRQGAVLLGRHRPAPRLVLPRGHLPSTRRDLRPRLRAARRPMGPPAARRAVQEAPARTSPTCSARSPETEATQIRKEPRCSPSPRT